MRKLYLKLFIQYRFKKNKYLLKLKHEGLIPFTCIVHRKVSLVLVIVNIDYCIDIGYNSDQKKVLF